MQKRWEHCQPDVWLHCCALLSVPPMRDPVRAKRIHNDGHSYYRQQVRPYYELRLQNPTMPSVSRKLHEA